MTKPNSKAAHTGDSMTQTAEAYTIKVGDELRDEFPIGDWVQVIEREAFKRGTRIWVCLANGQERTFVASTTLVINRRTGYDSPQV